MHVSNHISMDFNLFIDKKQLFNDTYQIKMLKTGKSCLSWKNSWVVENWN